MQASVHGQALPEAALPAIQREEHGAGLGLHSPPAGSWSLACCVYRLSPTWRRTWLAPSRLTPCCRLGLTQRQDWGLGQKERTVVRVPGHVAPLFQRLCLLHKCNCPWKS